MQFEIAASYILRTFKNGKSISVSIHLRFYTTPMIITIWHNMLLKLAVIVISKNEYATRTIISVSSVRIIKKTFYNSCTFLREILSISCIICMMRLIWPLDYHSFFERYTKRKQQATWFVWKQKQVKENHWLSYYILNLIIFSAIIFLLFKNIYVVKHFGMMGSHSVLKIIKMVILGWIHIHLPIS